MTDIIILSVIILVLVLLILITRPNSHQCIYQGEIKKFPLGDGDSIEMQKCIHCNCWNTTAAQDAKDNAEHQRILNLIANRNK